MIGRAMPRLLPPDFAITAGLLSFDGPAGFLRIPPHGGAPCFGRASLHPAGAPLTRSIR